MKSGNREVKTNRRDPDCSGTAGLGFAIALHSPDSRERKLAASQDQLQIPDNLPKTPLSSTSSSTFLSQETTAQNTPRATDENVNSCSVSKKGGQQDVRAEKLRSLKATEIIASNVATGEGLVCPAEADNVKDGWSWSTVPILVLASYSTFLSGIFLGIALSKPRWGQLIGTGSQISLTVATSLSTALAKTIELSFVTVFVALLGQVLSRRVIARNTRAANAGISIVEMTMRSWITQPEILLMEWTNFRYGATTIFGIMTIVAMISATFYGTAGEALVSPKLKYGPREDRVLTGKVSSEFANRPYLWQNCETPIPDEDSERGRTCLDNQLAGQSFGHFGSYLKTWTDKINTGNTSTTPDVISGRPPPFAMLYDNTTVSGQWINPNYSNITTNSTRLQRLVHNSTMAMPHGNVIQAVRDNKNGLLQPDDRRGVGEYVVKASLPAPSLNVLCVGMSGNELDPFIHAQGSGPAQAKTTAVDDLFFFSEKYGSFRQPVPYFQKRPIAYNAIVNSSDPFGPSAIYMLATPPPNTTTNEHVLCSMRALQYSDCTTQYRATEAGGHLSVHCGHDPGNTLPYHKSKPSAPSFVWDKNWKDVGSEWITAISLNSGISNDNASVARLVTEMIPKFDLETQPAILDSSRPSIGEALGVLAGGTLLLSSIDAPFTHEWNYSSTYFSLKVPQYQLFNATVSFKDYASGGTQRWQAIFYVVLFAVFLMNCFALVWLTWRFGVDGQVTDYTDPANLFALAINSPPSKSLLGACGDGPHGHALGKKWQVAMDVESNVGDGQDTKGYGKGEGKRPHYYIKCLDDETKECGKI